VKRGKKTKTKQKPKKQNKKQKTNPKLISFPSTILIFYNFDTE